MLLRDHPEHAPLLARLQMNPVLRLIDPEGWLELGRLLSIEHHHRGVTLSKQGSLDPAQYFVIDGVLKRSVTREDGKVLILRFATETGMETSYEFEKPALPAAYSISAATNVRIARISQSDWSGFLARHPAVKEAFKSELIKLMNQMTIHLCRLHLLDARGRTTFMQRSPDLMDRLSFRDVARYLNIAPETLSRLKRQQMA